MHMTRWMVAAVLAATIAAPIGAQGRGRGRGGEAAAAGKGGAKATIVFNDKDRTTVRDYFVAHPLGVKALPPGIAKNVARGKPLPPGIARRAVPRDLMAIMPRPEPGVTFSIVGNMVVAIQAGVVVDVLLDIAR